MNKKGFTLIELIVVIAILAVLTAVLVPTFIHYIDETRQSKDDSAMGTVVDAVQMAMADENVYNEVLDYVCSGNYSCYIDSSREADYNANKEITVIGTDSDAEQYRFKDVAREKDGTVFYVAGNMRGVTITFQPELNGMYGAFNVKDAIINKFIATGLQKNAKTVDETIQIAEGRSAVAIKYIYGTANTKEHGTLSTMTEDNVHNYLYNKVFSVVGDNIEISSRCYRASEYTIFIQVEETSREMTMKNTVHIYGQWNGTNLG